MKAASYTGRTVAGLPPSLMLSSAVYWLGAFLALMTVGLPQFRYLFFSLPFLVLIAAMGDRGWRLGDESKPFLVFVLVGLILSPLANREGIKDLYLTLSGVAIGFLLSVPRLKLNHLFVAVLITACIYFAQVFGHGAAVAFSLEQSSSPFESNFSFLFGLLAVFALLERRFWLYVLCVALAILTLKRIAVLGALLVAVFVLIGEKRGRRILNPPVMLLANLVLVFSLFSYGMGYFDNIIMEITGQTANQFGQGRKFLLQLPAIEVFRAPEQFLLFGQGPGATYTLAAKGAMNFGHKTNLHSDLIKIFYEYGLVFFSVFICLLYSAKSYKVRVSCLFMNVLFVTDNVLIYYYLLFFLVAGVRSLVDPEREGPKPDPNFRRPAAIASPG